MKHGYLFLHGKGSGPDAPICTMNELVNGFRVRAGELVDYVQHSWGYNQLYTQPFEVVIAEVDAAVQRLKDAGADYIHIISHSIGCNVALYYATKRTNFNSIVLLAPAHNTHTLKMQFLTEWSRRKANTLLATPGYNIATVEQFVDNSVTDVEIVNATALNYLSYMDPAGNTNMVTNLAKISRPLNVLLIAGRLDLTQVGVLPSLFNKINKTTLSTYQITNDTHVSVSGSNSYDTILNWTRSVV
jgi:pimeloyl-ACP methyl ester carboxylesterase